MKGFNKGLSSDGNIGEDILQNLKTIKYSTKIEAKKVPRLLEVRCGVFINKKILQR